MPEKTPPDPLPADREPETGGLAGLGPDPWRRLTEAASAEEFCSSWLELQARMIGGVAGGAVFFERPGSISLAPVAVWPVHFRDPGRFARVVDRALRERKGVVLRDAAESDPEPAAEPRLLLAYPVRAGDRVHGVAALQIEPRGPIPLQTAMRQLQWGAAWLQGWILRQAADPEARATRRLSITFDLAAIVLEEERFQAAATALVTELATRLRCDRVSLGFVKGAQVRVGALSHSAQFGSQMNLIRAIGQAMSESVDQGTMLVYPPPEETRGQVLHFHEQLVRGHGDRAICTIPFVHADGRAFGALTLERSGPEPFDRPTLDICDGVAALVGPILEEKRRNDRHVLLKVADSLWTQIRRLVGPRHSVRKLVAVGVAGLILFFTFATGQYRVTAKTILEGEVQRAVSAPYRGFITEAPVRAGDLVREGQTLCALDDRDLRLEHAKWTGEREQYQVEHRKSMADRESAAMGVLSKKMRQAEAQIALLDAQIARARIVAPFDGVVVSGDLSQSLGAPVDVGETLFQIAPLHAYRVILEVDERDIREIAAGQKGHLVLTAFPESRFGFAVTTITPVSRSEDGRNTFRVEARLDQATERLRPGMEGFGKIDIDRRQLLWIWTHDLIDWVRLWAWTWLP
jgi:RND family efflux transporter MFP subunit